ncbi:MAG: hypothetical protein AB1540_02315 [Bdellovibrionota bacterium]
MKTYLEFSEIIEGKQNDFKKIGKVTTESVFKGTKRHWKEWVAVLEKAGARSWTHSEIAEYLKVKYKLTPWWQQGVAVGFEIAIGRRKEGQDAKGNYMVTATKSLPHGAPKVWGFLISEKGQRIWLNPLAKVEIRPKSQFETSDGYFGEIRTMKKNRRVRLFWQDPQWQKKTVVELLLVARPAGKSILVFNHTGIKDEKTQTLLRGRWRKVADEVFRVLG